MTPNITKELMVKYDTQDATIALEWLERAYESNTVANRVKSNADNHITFNKGGYALASY